MNGRCGGCLALMLALCFVPRASAQEPAPADGEGEVITLPDRTRADDKPAPTPTPGVESSSTRLDDIVVTANKKEEVLRDIPASIVVLGGEQLEQSGAQSMEDFLKLVPGVNFIPNEPGAVKVTIRGISSELGTNATTGLLFGNVSFNDAWFPFVSMDPNPFDLYDVEVLKGPQGTLYGASALNGAVRYVPQPPQFGVFETRYFAQYTQVSEGGGDPIYGAAVNLPLGEDAALRVVGFDRRSPGYTDDTGRGLADINRIRQDGLRAMAAWNALEGLGVSLLFMQQDTQFADEPFADNRDGRLERDNTPAASPKDSFYDLADLGLQYDFGWATFNSETALVRKRFWEGPEISRLASGEADESTISTRIFFNSDTWSQEFRLASPAGADGPWSWVAGAFWQDQPIDSGFDIFTTQALPAGSQIALPDLSALGGGAPLGEAFITADGQPILGHQRADIVVRELALFGELTRDFWEKGQAALGLRAYRTRSGGVTRASGALYGGAENRNEGEVREQGVNPKFSLRWRFNPRTQGHALVSRGFRVGGIQPTASSLSTSVPRSFKSDHIWNYEAGLRTEWMDDSLRADLTVFHEDWKAPQLAQRDPQNPNPVATYYDNVGGARSDGAEFALEWRTPFEGLRATFTAAYVRTVTTVPFTTASGVDTQPGTPWPYAPRWQTASTLSYQRPLWRAWEMKAGLTHTWMSEAFTTLANDVPVFDYALLDGQLGLVDSTGAWPEFTLTVNNLGDERGINQHAFTGPASDVIYVRPRAVTLHLMGRF